MPDTTSSTSSQAVTISMTTDELKALIRSEQRGALVSRALIYTGIGVVAYVTGILLEAARPKTATERVKILFTGTY